MSTDGTISFAMVAMDSSSFAHRPNRRDVFLTLEEVIFLVIAVRVYVWNFELQIIITHTHTVKRKNSCCIDDDDDDDDKRLEPSTGHTQDNGGPTILDASKTPAT